MVPLRYGQQRSLCQLHSIEPSRLTVDKTPPEEIPFRLRCRPNRTRTPLFRPVRDAMDAHSANWWRSDPNSRRLAEPPKSTDYPIHLEPAPERDDVMDLRQNGWSWAKESGRMVANSGYARARTAAPA
jgi:hypothetical protein